MEVVANLVRSIEREEWVCELALRQLGRKCEVFEKKYGMSSQCFRQAFLKGDVGDDLDFFKWKALVDAIDVWVNTKEELWKLKP